MSKHRPHTRTIWTELEIEQLKQAIADGKPMTDIARMLNRSYASVRGKKRTLGLLTPQQQTSPRLAELIKFRMAGWTLQQIAKVYRVSDKCIAEMLNANGFKGKWSQKGFFKRAYIPTHWSEIDMHLLRKYLKKGYSLERIATYFPKRSLQAISTQAYNLTRHWGTPEQRAHRKAFERRAKEKQLRVY